MGTNQTPTEATEQILVVQYLELIGAKFSSVPNSTWTKSWAQKRKNTATGLRPGFPDMVIIVDNHFFCIELKRVKGSVTSQEQKDWHGALIEAGIDVYVCRGFVEAKEVIDSYRTL